MAKLGWKTTTALGDSSSVLEGFNLSGVGVRVRARIRVDVRVRVRIRVNVRARLRVKMPRWDPNPIETPPV